MLCKIKYKQSTNSCIKDGSLWQFSVCMLLFFSGRKRENGRLFRSAEVWIRAGCLNSFLDEKGTDLFFFTKFVFCLEKLTFETMQCVCQSSMPLLYLFRLVVIPLYSCC